MAVDRGHFSRRAVHAAVFTLLLAGGASAAIAAKYGAWGEPVNAEDFSGGETPNSSAGDGCPYLDPYSKDLYIASTRTGGLGGLDIWIAPWNGSGWDEPVNPGAPINSSADDFCPSPARGNRLYFVSKRDEPNGDIYVIKRKPDGSYRDLSRLPAPVNSPAQEWSPSVFENGAGETILYFSSTRNGGQDIFRSVNFSSATEVVELNTIHSDARPNVRRDGLEIVFDSDRPGGLGASDVWSASRGSTSEPWGAATPLTVLNSPSGESRASLSWDGAMIVFGSGRPGGEGGADVYVSTRDRGGKRRGPKVVEF